jgi:hypothetical protein
MYFGSIGCDLPPLGSTQREPSATTLLLKRKQWDGRPHPVTASDVPKWELLSNHLNRSRSVRP